MMRTGHLLSRWGKPKLLKEVFTYDSLVRLATAQVQTTNASGGVVLSDPLLSYNYDGSVGGSTRGNLVQRTDIGKYNTNSFHRITSATGPDYPFPYDDPPLAITPGPQAITYTSYHQPASLSETIDGTSYLLEYTYDADQQRNYSKLRNMTTQSTVEERWYEHGLETQRLNGNPSTDRKILYVQGGDGLCAMIVAETGGAQTAYAVYKDHLGSIVAVTRHTFSPELLGGGNSGIPEIMAEQNFDAWGRRRNPNTWTYTSLPVLPSWLYRGYTGHEHMEHFSLINMNGRLYDPLNGRMLSADNYVQGALGTQGYNRYSYAGNNPLKYTDPEGEWVHLVIGAVVGGTLNWIANGAEFSWNGLGHFGVGAAAGALSAGIGAGVGTAIAGNAAAGGGFAAGFLGTATISSTGFVAGAALGASAGFTNGFITGLGNTALNGGTWGESALAGLNSGWKQGLVGGVTGGVIGGIHATRNGRTFWTGGYKTHRIAGSNLLASIDDGGVVSSDGEVFYTVKNQSGETIYYKPETNNPIKGIRGDGAYPLRNGRALVDPIDGVTAPGRPGEVFKITNPFSNRATGVTVYDNFVLIEPRALWPITNDLNQLGGGGWLTSPPNAGWNNIFRMSGYIFR